jgi:hypothetical protein
MSPKINEIVDYIQTSHPEVSSSLDEVVRDCASHGFSVVLIIAGIQLARGVAPDDAKELVAGHPVWGNARAEWEQFREDLEKTLDAESESDSQERPTGDQTERN